MIIISLRVVGVTILKRKIAVSFLVYQNHLLTLLRPLQFDVMTSAHAKRKNLAT